MAELTKAKQRLAVAQGLALGAAMVPIDGIGGDPMRLKLTFARAWRGWRYADRFGTIKVGPPTDEIHLILEDEARRGRRGVAWWTGRWPFVPATDGDNWDDLAGMIDDEVPAEAWRELVAAWVAGRAA